MTLQYCSHSLVFLGNNKEQNFKIPLEIRRLKLLIVNSQKNAVPLGLLEPLKSPLKIS